jgi:hypothetical protein
VGIFFDESLSPIYMLSDYEYSCTGACTVSMVSHPSGGDIWHLQSSIDCHASELEDGWEVLFPLAPVWPFLPRTIYVVLSTSVDVVSNILHNPPMRVFRINGAVINNDYRVPIQPIQGAEAADLTLPYMEVTRGTDFDLHLLVSSITSHSIHFSTIDSNYILDYNMGSSIGSGLTIVSLE